MTTLVISLAACDDATLVIVDNAYTDGTNVDATWWSETYVPDVVVPSASSPAYRAGPASDYAYAVIDRGGALVIVRSKTALAVDRSSTLHITVSPTTFDGDCGSPGFTPLPQPVADLVTQSIFPNLFEGALYDAATCRIARP